MGFDPIDYNLICRADSGIMRNARPGTLSAFVGFIYPLACVP